MSSTEQHDRKAVQRLCKENMQACAIGQGDAQLQNGTDFYKYFFTNFPDLRVYFKGAEKYTAEDVQKSDRFQKQGQRILLAMHITVDIFCDEMVFQGYVRETVNRHRQFKMDPALWGAFWTVWVGYLESKTTLTEAHKKAWATLGEDFARVARGHLKNSGLPH